jgi:hypothetical protein
MMSLLISYCDSALPCFLYKTEILQQFWLRFQMELSEEAAAEYMAKLVSQALKDNWTGNVYDGIQKIQNNIYSAEWR